MGHVRLGRLPKTNTWQDVIQSLESPNSSLKDITRLTSKAVHKTLANSKNINNLARCFGNS